MNIIEIPMPQNVRYMSEGKNVLFSILPPNGKYILDKALTGCGGTELFLNSGRPLVLISPRSGVLSNKANQHPECHLFRSHEKEKLDDLKTKLRYYLDSNHYISGMGGTPPKILITLDSAKYVIEELQYRRTINNFLFLVDEFQCLISDASFKGKTDLEFLKMLDGNAQNICYMSATPAESPYLDALVEFRNCIYYKLEWDPNVLVEPTVKEILMRKGETPITIFSDIIRKYRRDGYFARKIINGHEYKSTEAVVFINEVKTILKIIQQNNLMPTETTILISESNKEVKKLERLGFTIGEQCTDRNNPVNKTFTFCSKASFEGRDFYSTNAFTYIFLDGTKDWQTHDISIEIPQMLGRQRLDVNLFKYNAMIYYRTKPCVESQNDFMTRMKEKLDESQTLINIYNKGDIRLKKALANTIRNKDCNNPYASNYLDVVNDYNGYSLEINFLSAAGEHILWSNQANTYNNPMHLTTAIQTQMEVAGTKPQELRDFENSFNKELDPVQKMRLYSTFRACHSEYTEQLYQNPFIDFEYHKAFNLLGPDELMRLNYDLEAIDLRMIGDAITIQCQSSFIKGKFYRADEVKEILQRIYDNVGYSKAATASQLSNYINIRPSNRRMDDGSRQKVFEIV